MIERVPDSLKSADRRLVLVVDDEPRMIRFIRMNLELEGYHVVEASNGIDDLEYRAGGQTTEKRPVE